MSDDRILVLPGNVESGVSKLSNAAKVNDYQNPLWEPYLGNGELGSFSSSGNYTNPNGADAFLISNNINFTINTGHTFTFANRCAWVLYCQGTCTINGTLDISGKGINGYTGTIEIPIKKLKNFPDVFKYLLIPAKGAESPHIVYYPASDRKSGNNGNAGIRVGETGSGGDGGVDHNSSNAICISRKGQSGSATSGGTGGGGAGNASISYNDGHDLSSGTPNGGKGGNGYGYRSGGGAGNPGGGTSLENSAWDSPGETGTGAMLVIIAKDFTGNGNILNTGKAGGSGQLGGGGGSGGGSVTIRTLNSFNFNGNINTSGGPGGSSYYSAHGGSGGAGYISISQLI
jgi:hypothetical protein